MPLLTRDTSLLKSPRLLRFLLLLHVPIFAIAGFWPFNFFQRNLVERLDGRPGLLFGRLGIAFTDSALPAPPGSEFTIELLAESEETVRNNVAGILCLYDGKFPENLMLGQWRSGLVLRTAIRSPERLGRYRETGVASVLAKGKTNLLTVTASAAGTSFYSDGVLLSTAPRHYPDPGVFQGQLVLGNTAHGHAPWKGRIFGVGLFDRSLTDLEVAERWRAWSVRDRGKLAADAGLVGLYLFDEDRLGVVADHSTSRRDIRVPARYTVLRRVVLESLGLKTFMQHPNVPDLAVNTLGFIPFGFLLAALFRLRPRWRRWSVFVIVVLSGTLASLAIEGIQVFLPTRSSSLLDVVTNAAGSAIGAALFFIAIRLAGEQRA